MTKLFGIDIAVVVNDSIAAAGGVRSGSLVTSTPGTRTTGSLTAGNQPTEKTYACKGFVEHKAQRREGQVTGFIIPIVTILGASVSAGAVAPAVNDKITIDSVTYRLTELVSRDPASAVYEFAAEGI